MQVINIEIDKLIPYVSNSRTHSEEQIAQIAASIKEFGWTNPILVDGDNGIIAGHGRVLAARKLGIDKIPSIELSGLTKAQKRAYVIADNKLALNSGWDEKVLASELKMLRDDSFDLDVLGFSDDELNDLLLHHSDGGSAALTDEDAVPDVPETPKSKLGDVWLLGKHRVMCGDSTDIDVVNKLLNNTKVDVIYTDPPYGISIVQGSSIGGAKPFGSVGGEKLCAVGKYSPVAGDDSIDVAIKAIELLNKLKAKVEIVWGGNYYANYLSNSSCWIVWDKENTGNFADAELAWTNQKTATRIFKHMWNGMLKASERGEKRVHPTQKPVALAEWCLDKYGDGYNTVLDLFGGSGSTLIACENKDKAGHILELSPAYVDVIVKRWQDYTGKQAIHAETKEPF